MAKMHYPFHIIIYNVIMFSWLKTETDLYEKIVNGKLHYSLYVLGKKTIMKDV